MKLKPFGPKTTMSPLSLEPSSTAAPPVVQSRKQDRRQIEELKVQIMELAEHQMEVTVRVLKNWIDSK